MHPRAASRSSGQRRPRLLRASVTEPSLFTSSPGNHALDMAPPTSYRSSHSGGHTSPNGGDDNGASGYNTYRRATDLLNHVAYLSSCATSPVASLTGSPLFDRMSGGGSRRTSPHSSDRRSSAAAVVGSSRGHGTTGVGSTSGGHGGSSIRSTGDASVDSCRRRANTDEVFGSSPASTHTSSSLDDLQHSPCSANYYSFPSFDMYDDSQDKEDDDIDN